MNTFQNDALTQLAKEGAESARNAAEQSADKAEEVLTQSKRAAAETEKTIQAGLNHLREAVPATLSRATTQAEDMARAGIEKARAAGTNVANQAHRVGDKTRDYVRDEPTKAILMAVAAGAAATLLISWATRSRQQRY
jgi:ElaB/YqjD/DUF883 family membrane-anchored ribosome-binding protein